MTKNKIEEIANVLQNHLKHIFESYNLDIKQINSKFGDGSVISFKIDCYYEPDKIEEYSRPDTKLIQKGDIVLPALGSIIKDGNKVNVKIVDKKQVNYTIKLNDIVYSVNFKEVYKYEEDEK